MINQPALFPMRQNGITSDDYYTPKWVFDALGVMFDIDVASPPDGPPNTPCKAYFTQETDGLSQNWYGTVFMNPPYSNATPWVHKWIEHADGIALVPFVKSKWFQALWDNPDTSFAYIRAIKFDRPTKELHNQAPFALGLWAIGEKATKALHNSNLGKIR